MEAFITRLRTGLPNSTLYYLPLAICNFRWWTGKTRYCRTRAQTGEDVKDKSPSMKLSKSTFTPQPHQSQRAVNIFCIYLVAGRRLLIKGAEITLGNVCAAVWEAYSNEDLQQYPPCTGTGVSSGSKMLLRICWYLQVIAMHTQICSEFCTYWMPNAFSYTALNPLMIAFQSAECQA